MKNRSSVILHGATSGKVSKTFFRSFSCYCREIGLPLPVRPSQQNPAYQKEYRKFHRERLNFEAARRRRERRREDPEKARAVARKEREQQLNKPGFRIRSNLSRRINKAIKGISKSAHTVELVGCSIEFFMSHLQSLFRPGMTWENYGPVWHVDHIKPCVLFDLTDPEQQKACFNWKNQQPLFALENLRKNAKYAGPR